MGTWLRWFAVSMVIGMQAGTVFKFLGDVGDTRWADWVDLLTPYAVVATAAMVVMRAGASQKQWLLLWVGALTFTLGHGLHLAANSISNALAPAIPSVVHLWDEVVSHYLWYTGAFVMMAAVASALRGRDLAIRWVDLALATAVGVTLFNTYVEGGVPVLGLGFLAITLIAAMRWRGAAISRLMLVVGGVGLTLMVIWGAYWWIADGLVFPEFSELGWI